MKSKSYDNFFANFSNKTRMGIIITLMDGPLNVGEIVKKVGAEQSNVSHHLQHLIKCKLLMVKRDGKKRIYRLNKKTIYPMLQMVNRHVGSNCSGSCRGCTGCH
ncbi:MAG: metalloregulator ArsR/SmtB family transcription factor [Nanoarchaeota archaeon]